MRLLLVEDDKKISNFIKQGLSEEAYLVDQAFDGYDGEEMFYNSSYNLIILDLMLPRLDGFTLCQRFRENHVHTPILMLTAKGQLADKVKGFDLGADDYLVKPFEFEELLARVRALLRRNTSQKQSSLQVADLILDYQSHQVSRAGQAIPLTRQEYRLLEYLMLNQGLAVSRSTLAESVWQDSAVSNSTIDVYINYLRNKLDKPFQTSLIHTIRGIGYMLRAR